MKRYLKNRKGSMMEYFVLTVVALLIGAAVFTMGRSVRSGIDRGKSIVDTINGRLEE